MNYFNHNLDLPYSKLNVRFRELTTNEQLILSKTNLTLKYDSQSYYEYFVFLNEVFKNCVHEYDDVISKIDIIEYVMLISKIRSISIGNNIEFYLDDTNNPDIKKQKITLNLNLFIKNLYESSGEFLTDDNNMIIDNDFIILLKYPSIKNILLFLDTKTYDSFNDTICEFIDEIQIKNNKIKVCNFTKNQKQELLYKLSISIKQKIEIKIFNLIETMLSKNLLGLEYFKDYKFNIYGFGFMSYLKLFFSYDIRSLYMEIYHLACNKLNPEYILNISPSERKIYISIINEINASKSQSSSNSSSIPSWSDVINKVTDE
jgi:hypothetical protein